MLAHCRGPCLPAELSADRTICTALLIGMVSVAVQVINEFRYVLMPKLCLGLMLTLPTVPRTAKGWAGLK